MKNAKRGGNRKLLTVTTTTKKMVGGGQRLVGGSKGVRKVIPKVARQGILRIPRAPAAVTMDGLKWALACLHPCNEGFTEAVAIPDPFNLPRHCTRMQRTFTISFPTENCQTNVGPSLDQCSWNLMVVTTPWPEYPFFFTFTEGTDEPVSLTAYLREQGKLDNTIYPADDPKVTLAKGIWYYTSFPNFMDMDAFADWRKDQPNACRQRYQKIRVVAKGTTTYLNASRLYDGGRVITGQYPCAARYLDSFNTESYTLPMSKILDAVKSAFCVEGNGSSQHTHSVDKISTQEHQHVTDLEHFHYIAQADSYPHKHHVGLPHSHGVRVDMSHGHSIDPHSHSIQHLGHTHKVQGETEGFTDVGLNVITRTEQAELVVGELIKDTLYTTSVNEARGYSDDSICTMPRSTTETGLREPVLSGGATVVVPEHRTRTADFVDGTLKLPSKEELVAAGSYSDEQVDKISALVKLIREAECKPLKKKDDVELERLTLVRDEQKPDLPEWFCSEPPSTENAMFYGDHKACTWPARHGTYMPIRIERYDMEDCNTGRLHFYELTKKETQLTPEANIEPVPVVNVNGTGTWGVTYYRNINKATSVTIKCVQYTEGTANPVGPFANLTPMNVDPDPAAIEFVTLETRRLQHAYYARANDLSEILGNIFKVAKEVGRVVKGVSSSLTGVPVIGDLASGLSGLLGGLGI